MNDTDKNAPAKVFISYATEDYDMAKRLYDDLKKEGAEPWIDREDLLVGQKWKTTIQQAIKVSRYFLLLISEHSVSTKGHFQKEQRTALDILDGYPSDEIFIIPARLDNTEPIDEKLRNIHWADLSNYEEGLKQVMKVIKPNNDVIITEDIEFVNRVSELQYFITNIHCPTYLLISAPMGYGKTRLIEAIKYQSEKQNRFCIHVRLSRKKSYSVRDLSFEILSQLGEKESDTADPATPEITGRRVGKYILEKIKNQRNVLILIDEVESVNDNSAKQFFNQFILSIRKVLSISDNTIQLRFILAGRYLLNWEKSDINLPLKLMPLSPFDFYAVYQTVENFASKSKLNANTDYKQEFASHLMYLTGGHPGCMAEILKQDYGSLGEEIVSNEEKYFETIIKPIIGEIKEHISDDLKKISDTISVVRRFNSRLLRHLIDNNLIEWSESEHELEDKLLQTYLINRKDGFLQDDITRRLLAINLRKSNLNRFIRICEQAISFYDIRLRDSESHRRDIIAIELLYQKMQYICYKENRNKEHFLKNLTDILDILSSGEDCISVMESFIQLLNEDWEFRFMSYYLFHDDIYKELIDKINNFLNESRRR